jgi:predicted MFS family arabinose efflux permease
VGLVNVATSAVGALLVLLALDELGLSEAGFGYLLGVGAVGGLLGSLAADELRILFGRPSVLVLAGGVAAAGEWLVATSPTWQVAALGLALVTFAGGTFNVVGRSLRQAVVPD